MLCVCICRALLSGAGRKNENWESKLSFQAEEFLKEREQRDGEVKSWEKEKKRWKAFKTELETEVCFFSLSLVMHAWDDLVGVFRLVVPSNHFNRLRTPS